MRGDVARRLLRQARWGLAELGRFVVLWLAGIAVLGLLTALLPGISADGPAALALAVVVVAAVTAALRPVLAALAVALSWAGVVCIGLLAQALTMYAGLLLAPGMHVDGLRAALAAAWLYAAILAVVSWLMLVDDDAALLAYVVRSVSRSHPAELSDAHVDGVVVVQLDGVGWPILQLLVNSGDLPTLSRWVRSGSHVMRPWHARLPCTTPVSQAGILHGSTAGMPAFRWYEKSEGRLLVANRPADAAEMERRLSDGTGLLADDGASIGNLFSGDAEVSLLTMSRMSAPRSGLGPAANYAAFMFHPFGFTRDVVLSIGEMVAEVFQARRQVRRDVRPRVNRHGSYVVLRAVTNVLLRDLNMALVAEQLMRGRRVVFVDFVDYDEIAHHAGPVRPESLRALAGLDHLLRGLEQVAREAPRTYHFVLLSDHGQSQGATFRQRYGQGLEDVVRELTAGDVAEVTSTVEDWGPVNVFLSQVLAQGGSAGGAVRRGLGRRAAGGQVSLGPGEAEREAAEREAGSRPEVVVVGSGNLGLVWFAREAGRCTAERIDARYPGLVGALANHPGIGWVLFMTDDGDPLVVGRDGVRRLPDGEVEGADPLAGLPGTAAEDLDRLARLEHAPDLYVGSRIDPSTQDVAAFEELVGSHGGLGGWQTEAMLVHPADWPVDLAHPQLRDGVLYGAEALHAQLVRWLERLGHRGAGAPSPAPGATGRTTGGRRTGGADDHPERRMRREPEIR